MEELKVLQSKLKAQLPELELDPGSGPAAGNEQLRKRDGLGGRTREGEKN